MDEQITQLDKRLTTVEHTVVSLSTEVEFSRIHYATKEDIARLDTKVSVIQSNYVTREDLAATERKLTAQISALEFRFAQLEIRLMRWSLGMVIGFTGVVAGLLKLMT